MVDDESCCSREVETDQTQPRDPKLHIYDKVSRRLRNREDAGLPGFDDELWAHFSRLPARYARAIDLQRAEDVVMHKCLLHRAAGSANGLAFHVRLLQVPQEHDSQERSGQNCSANLRFGRHIHEITFAAYNKPNLLSQLTCLVSELDLNIQEAHAFNTNDGCALDVFVVDGWPYEESERLRYAIHKGVHKSANEVWRKSHMLLPAMQDEEMRDEPALDRVQIPTDGTDEWEVNIKLLQFGTKLASASYGNLYRGMYCNQDVTIKVLNPENISTEMKREFAQEVYIMRKVRHKNVVQFIGACTRAPNLWIVTESMPGGSLHNFIHKQKCILKLPNLLKVALDISKGMNYLHLCNIIHRDLKSANLLMDENKVVKVADFGVARVKSQSGVMTSETGTYRWMAPEVIEHRPYNQKADIFSFGIVLWELLTAKMPYEKMTPLQVALGVVQKGLRPSIPAGTHSKLAALIERCWHQDPHLRPDFSEVSEILQFIAREVGDEKLGRGFWRLSSGATNASLHPAAMFSACRMAQ